MAGSNSLLGKTLNQPFAAAVVVYAVGLFTATLVFVVSATLKLSVVPSPDAFRELPWWGWIGGALGSVYIIAGITAAEKIGAGSFTGMTVTAAIITSLVMDHFGLVAFEQHSAGVARMIGALLMVSGLVLIAKF